MMVTGSEFRRAVKRWTPPAMLDAVRTARRNWSQGALPLPTSQGGVKGDEVVVQAFIERNRRTNAKAENALWWQKLYNRPSYNLGGTGLSYLQDVYSPLYDIAFVDKHLHDQFKEGAEHHAGKYKLEDYYQALLKDAFSRIGFSMETNRQLKVIDVGSGSGNTVIPMLNLFPNANLIATELSLQMLSMLKRRLVETGHGGKAALLQLNAEELDFRENSFDLVVGGAILHHMFNPDRTLRGAVKILKPGGHAIFFEPFSSGNMMLAVMFQTILDRALTHPIPEKLSSYLRSLLHGMNEVWGIYKADPRFEQIDDKWMFPKSYFLDMVGASGFSDCQIHSLMPIDGQFERQARTVLLLYGNVPETDVPEWVWDIFREYDRILPLEVKKDLLIEGCVILKK